MRQIARFGCAGGTMGNMSTILSPVRIASDPALSVSFPSGQVPPYPCYGYHSPASPDASNYNMFWYCARDNYNPTSKVYSNYAYLRSVLQSGGAAVNAIVLLGNEPDQVNSGSNPQDGLTPQQCAEWYYGIVKSAGILDPATYTYQKALPAIAVGAPTVQWDSVYWPSYSLPENPYSHPSMQGYMWDFFMYYKKDYGAYPPYEYAAYHLYPTSNNPNDPLADAQSFKNWLDLWPTFWNNIGLAIPPAIVTECGPNYGYSDQSDWYMRAFTAAMVQILEGPSGMAANIKAWCAFISYDSQWKSLFTDGTYANLTAYGQQYQHEGGLDVQLLASSWWAPNGSWSNITLSSGDNVININNAVPEGATMALVGLTVKSAYAGDPVGFSSDPTYDDAYDMTFIARVQVANQDSDNAGIAPVVIVNGNRSLVLHNYAGHDVTANLVVYRYA
ncbi:MAG: hypothetical protein HY675_15615 [Chloroflexi bacterium]|nr:hypothetical protein [Chloroflexota bacterium]